MNKNIKHFLVAFLVSAICLFGTSSCLTSLIVEAVRETKRQSKEASEGPKAIPGTYAFSAIAPSGQRLYYAMNHSSVRVVNPTVEYQGSWPVNMTSNYISGNVVVPEKVKHGDKEYTVEAISAGAFGLCSGITSIVLPKSIKRIEEHAFSRYTRTIVSYCFVPLRSIGYDKRVLMVSKELWESKYFNQEVSYEEKEKSFLTTIPITEDYSFFESGNIDDFFEKYKSSFETVMEWGPCRNNTYSFISISSNGQALCYTIAENGKTVGFTNPLPIRGNYVNGNVIIPDTVEYKGKKYPVTEIKRNGLLCKGASSYFFPNSVSAIGDNHYDSGSTSGLGQSVPFVVCYATNPPQRPEPVLTDYDLVLKVDNYKYSTLGSVVQVPKGCLDKYKTAETWSQQPELIMEVGDDFQQYLDEGRIDEYMEKAKNSINFDQMWAAQRNFDKKKNEQRENEKQAILGQREKERQAQWKKEVDQLKKQYGAKYVNDLFNNGKLVIGMPIGLVRYGLKNNLFKKPHLYYMNLEHQSANSESYELRGSYDGFSGSIYLGMVFFSNGKVSSIRWANY